MFFAVKENDIYNFGTPYIGEMSYMKFNTEKCHLLLSANKNEYMLPKLDHNLL